MISRALHGPTAPIRHRSCGCCSVMDIQTPDVKKPHSGGDRMRLLLLDVHNLEWRFRCFLFLVLTLGFSALPALHSTVVDQPDWVSTCSTESARYSPSSPTLKPCARIGRSAKIRGTTPKPQPLCSARKSASTRLKQTVSAAKQQALLLLPAAPPMRLYPTKSCARQRHPMQR